MPLSREETVDWIEKLRDQIIHNHCWSCDCLQGLLVQLELDCDEDVSDLTGPLKISRDRMHGCMGCDPCGPGSVYADYLRKHG
jgi:hypothetical protein